MVLAVVFMAHAIFAPLLIVAMHHKPSAQIINLYGNAVVIVHGYIAMILVPMRAVWREPAFVQGLMDAINKATFGTGEARRHKRGVLVVIIIVCVVAVFGSASWLLSPPASYIAGTCGGLVLASFITLGVAMRVR
jgi:hypothetical protein